MIHLSTDITQRNRDYTTSRIPYGIPLSAQTESGFDMTLLRNKIKKRYFWPCVLLITLSQIGAYDITRLFLADRPLYDLATPLDACIPFAPAWVTVYFLAFVFWAINGTLILNDSCEHAFGVTVSYLIAMFISAIIFLVFPSTIVRPEPAGNGFFENWVRLLYRIDAPNNLCPSIHVVASYFCWRGTWGCQRISKWYRDVSLGLLILVCMSILLVKQHAVVDIPAAVITSELSLQIGRRLTPLISEIGSVRKRLYSCS